MSETKRTGVEGVYWDNLNPGWFFTCLCGWSTRETDESIVVAAEILEDHWVADHEGYKRP